MQSRWFKKLGCMICLGCMLWGSITYVQASASLRASELALNLGAPVPCGDFICYPDMNDKSSYYFQPLLFELDNGNGRLPFYLLRATPQEGGLLLMQLRYATTSQQEAAAKQALVTVDRLGVLKGTVPLTQGMVAVGIITSEIEGAALGEVEVITVGRLSPTSHKEGMAALILSDTQLARLEAADKSSKERIILAVETATDGWYPPLEQALEIDTKAIADHFFVNDKQRWTGGEIDWILSQSRQKGWVSVAQPDETNEPTKLESWPWIKAHLMAEWFRPVIPVSQFASYYDDSDLQQIEARIQNALIKAVPTAEAITDQTSRPIKKRWFAAMADENSEEDRLSADQTALLRLAQKANDAGAEAYAAKKFTNAVEAFTRANELYRRVYSVTSPVVEYNIAQSYRQLNKCSQAITHYEQVINTPANKHGLNYSGYVGYSLLFIGQCLIELKQPDEALDYLYRALKLPEAPEKGQILMEVGETFARLNKYCPAMETLREAGRLAQVDEEAHLDLANQLFHKVAKKALADIRQREASLGKKTSSIETLRRVLSDYRDYVLCAHPVKNEAADIDRRIKRLEARLVDDKKTTLKSQRAESNQPTTQSFLSYLAETEQGAAQNVAMGVYRRAVTDALKWTPELQTHWQTGTVAGPISLLPVELQIRNEPQQRDLEKGTTDENSTEKSILLTLAGQTSLFFSEQIERVEVRIRRLNSAEESVFTLAEITPERFARDKNQFVIPLPLQNEMEKAGENNGSYEVRTSWCYRNGMRVEIPWRRYRKPWLVLESPHRERTIALFAQPVDIAKHGVQSATLTFHTQLDAQAVSEKMTLSAESPFLGAIVRLPVSIRSVPIEIEAEWCLKWRQVKTSQREIFYGRAFDWGKVIGMNKPVK